MNPRWNKSSRGTEPEILPPGEVDWREMQGNLRGRIPIESFGFQRVYISRIGPLRLFSVLLLASVIGAAIFIFTVSAFLILLPIAAAFLLAVIILGLLRGPSRWPR
ncbi:MAG TPA: hypothetical protein VEK34_04245 [Methylocella sp.]|nr:hypothetical protein [Methylocella sp.]